MSQIVPINHAALAAVAAETLDLVQRYGNALLINVDDMASLRRYIRSEGRRRNQRLRSYTTASEPTMVLVVVEDDEDLAPAARAWRDDADRRTRHVMRPGTPPLPRPWLLDVQRRA